MRNSRILQWTILLSVAWLGGCSHLEKSVEKNLNAAMALEERCRGFEEDTPAIDAQALLLRIKNRLMLACNAGGAACPFGLKAELEKTATWFANVETPKEVTNAVADFSAELAKFDQSVSKFVEDKNLVKEITGQWATVKQSCRTAPNPYQCNLSLNALVSTLSNAAKNVNGHGKGLVADLQASRNAWAKVLLTTGNSKAEMTTTGRQAVYQIGLALDAAGDTLYAIRDVAVEEFRADFFDRLLPTLTAEKVLDFTERQMEPVDRLVDKADQKIYMLGSFAIESSRADIQQHFDTFYNKYLRQKFRTTQSAVAFARAACVRLSKPTPAGKQPSLIMPFVYSTLTLVHMEKREKQACMDDPKRGTNIENASREQNCEWEVAKIRYEAAKPLASENGPPTPVEGSLESILYKKNKQREEEERKEKERKEKAKSQGVPPPVAARIEPPVPPPEIGPARINEVCLSSEQAWRRQRAAAGKQGIGRADRQASQQVCAEYLLDIEQKRYLQSEGKEVQLAEPQSSTELAQALDRIATKVLQMESANGKEPPDRLPVEPALPSAQNFCQWLRSAVSTVSCIDRVDASWLELPASFNSGSFESTSMVPALRTLSRAIEAYQPGVVEVLVLGAASAAPVRSTSLKAALAKRRSSSPYRCTGEGGAGAADPSGNRDLATLRADWAARVMAGAVPELKGKLKACPLSSQPESGDQPFDRRIAIKLRWKSDGASAASSAARTGSALTASSEVRR